MRGAGVEPAQGLRPSDLKSDAFDRSATPAPASLAARSRLRVRRTRTHHCASHRILNLRLASRHPGCSGKALRSALRPIGIHCFWNGPLFPACRAARIGRELGNKRATGRPSPVVARSASFWTLRQAARSLRLPPSCQMPSPLVCSRLPPRGASCLPS